MPKNQISQYYTDKENAYKASLHDMQKLLPSYVQPYLRSVELSRQVRTAIAYTRELITFFDFIIDVNPLYKNMAVKDIPIECIESLTYDDIDYYITYLSSSDNGVRSHRNTAHALNRAMSALRGYFGWATAHDYIVKNPTIGAAKPNKPKDKPIERLKQNEAQKLIEGVQAGHAGSDRAAKFAEKTRYRDTAIVVLLLNTGIRVSECVGLDTDSVDWDERSLTVVRKGGKIEKVYLNDDATEALYDYIKHERPSFAGSDDEPALFLSNRKNRMSVRSIQALIEKYGKSVLGDAHLHPHTLRKTYGTLLYESTGDIALVSETLGHKSVDTTRKHYSDVSDAHKRVTASINVYENNS